MKKIFILCFILIALIGNSISVQAQSEYWFPKGVESCMLTDSQMGQYRIVDMDKYRKSTNYTFSNSITFVEHKVKEAKAKGRPVIQKDLFDANNDYKILRNISISLNDGLSQSTGNETYGTLTQAQEVQLNRIINEYGTSVIDDKLKRKLERYKQRQAHMGTSNINGTSNQYQFANMPNPSDRSDIDRFYNGFEYTPVIPSASTVKNNIIQKGVDYLLGF